MTSRVQALVVTHGDLAAELLSTARLISGTAEGVSALCLDWEDSLEEARRKVEEAVRRLDQGSGVLILTDIFGDTPSNAAIGLRKPGRIEVVTGVNLPMVLRLACSGDRPEAIRDLALWIREKGRKSICLIPEPKE